MPLCKSEHVGSRVQRARLSGIFTVVGMALLGSRVTAQVRELAYVSEGVRNGPTPVQLMFSADGERLVAAGSTSATCWDLATGNSIWKIDGVRVDRLVAGTQAPALIQHLDLETPPRILNAAAGEMLGDFRLPDAAERFRPRDARGKAGAWDLPLDVTVDCKLAACAVGPFQDFGKSASEQLVKAESLGVSLSDDVMVFEPLTARPVRTLKRPSSKLVPKYSKIPVGSFGDLLRVEELKFSPDAEHLAARVRVGTIVFWKVSTGECIGVRLSGVRERPSVQLEYALTGSHSMTWSSQGRAVVASPTVDTTPRDGIRRLTEWRGESFGELADIRWLGASPVLTVEQQEQLVAEGKAGAATRVEPPTKMVVSPDGSRAICYSKFAVELVDLRNSRPIGFLHAANKIGAAAFDSTGARVAIAVKDLRTIHLMETRVLEYMAVNRIPIGGRTETGMPNDWTYVPAPDSPPLAATTSSTGGSCRTLPGDPSTWEPESAGHVAYSRDGKHVAIASQRSVVTWSVDAGKVVWSSKERTWVDLVGGSDAPLLIRFATPESVGSVIDGRTGKTLRPYALQPSSTDEQGLTVFAHDPNAKLAACVVGDDRFRRKSRGEVANPKPFNGVYSGDVVVVDVSNGKHVRKMKPPSLDRPGARAAAQEPLGMTPGLVHLQFSPDGAQLLGLVDSGLLVLWSVDTGLCTSAVVGLPSRKSDGRDRLNTLWGWQHNRSDSVRWLSDAGLILTNPSVDVLPQAGRRQIGVRRTQDDRLAALLEWKQIGSQGAPLRQLTPSQTEERALALLDGGRWETLEVVDLKNAVAVGQTYLQRGDWITDVAYSPDGQQVAIALQRGDLMLIDKRHLEYVASLGRSLSEANEISVPKEWSLDAPVDARGDSDTQSVEQPALEQLGVQPLEFGVLLESSSPVHALRFAPDGVQLSAERRLVRPPAHAERQATELHAWDSATGRVLFRGPVEPRLLGSEFRLLDDGRSFLVTPNIHNRLEHAEIRRMSDGSLAATLKQCKDFERRQPTESGRFSICAPAVSPTGRFAVVALSGLPPRSSEPRKGYRGAPPPTEREDTGDVVCVVDLATGSTVREFVVRAPKEALREAPPPNEQGRVRFLQFSSDEAHVAVVFTNGDLLIGDMNEGGQRTVQLGDIYYSAYIAVANGGGVAVASGGNRHRIDCTEYVRVGADGAVARVRWPAADDGFSAVSRDMSYAIRFRTDRGAIRLECLDLRSGEYLGSWGWPLGGRPVCAALSHDGSRLAVANEDGRVFALKFAAVRELLKK